MLPSSSGSVGLEVTHDQAADVCRIHGRSRQEVRTLRHEQRSRAGERWQAMRTAHQTGVERDHLHQVAEAELLLEERQPDLRLRQLELGVDKELDRVEARLTVD